jgi:hypothetical protein
MPVTTPAALMVATEAGAIFHVPPLTAFVKVIVLPAQTGALPKMGADIGFTVTIAVADPHALL